MMRNNEIVKWIKTWERADSALSEINKAELRDMDYYSNNINILLSMLQYAAEHRIERDSTGLVIQQKRFKKLHDKNPSL